MAVLNQGGNMVCDALLRLTVFMPGNKKTTFSSSNGGIRVNDECRKKDFTLIPDYEAHYQIDGPGLYEMVLQADTEEGTFTISDNFEVRESVDFDVERYTATRIYPPATYPAIFTVKANQDYRGIVEESVPDSFETFDLTEKEISEFFKVKLNPGLAVPLEEKQVEGRKIISWFVDWKAGETYNFGYQYKVLGKSPEFYLLGPLRIGDFAEVRQWMLAVDAQFTRPDGDHDIGATWGALGSASSPWWDDLDEGATGDSNGIVTGNNPDDDTTDDAIFTTTNVSDPGIDTGHILRAKWQEENGGNRTMDGRLRLYQGDPNASGTLIATLLATNIGDAFQTDTYTLSSGEAGNITDYTDLYLRVTGQWGGSGSPATLGVDYIELEVPDFIFSVSGNVYNFGTASALTECDTDGGTDELSLRASSTTYTTSCGDSDGAFTFSAVTQPSAGDGMVIWIDDAEASETDGAMVIRYDGVGTSISNIFYDDAVTITSDDTNPVDTTDMDVYDDGQDADIPYTATGGTSVSVNSGYELLVKIKSGVTAGSDVFDPNGTVTMEGADDLHLDDNSDAYLDTATSDLNGDITIDTGATLTISANTTISGATSGNITATGTLAYTGTPDVTISVNSTISGGGSITFYDLSTATSGTTTISSAVTAASDVDVGAGTTLRVNANLNIDGGALTTTTTGIIDYTSGTPNVTLDGSGNIGFGTGSIKFYDLTTNGVGHTTIISSNNIVIDNGLSVGESHAFAMGTNSLTIGSTAVVDSGDITMSTGASSSQSASGTVTILSSASGTADFEGPGEFDAYILTIGNGSTAFTTDNESGSDLVLDVANDFTITTNATFNASSTASFQVFADWTNSGSFEAGTGTVTFDSNVVSGRSISGSLTGSNAYYNLSFNDGGSNGDWTFDSDATVDNDFTITGGAVTAPIGTLSVGHNFDNDDIFTHNSGTVALTGAADTTQTVTSTATLAFNTLSATGGDRIINFEASRTFTIAASANLTLTGTSCTALLVLRSTTPGTQFTLTDNTGGTTSVDYADIQDSNASIAITASNSVNSDNNSNWTIAANTCIGASTDTNDTATGYSFQRKTFWDSANSRYWLFYHDGTHIEIRNSSDGSTWNVDDDILAYDTNDFSVWWQQIGVTEYVWLAVTDSNDIKVRQGTLTATNVTWDTDVATILDDADGRCTSYSHPYISLDSPSAGNPHVWAMARCFDGTNYVIEARDTSTTADADPSTWAYNSANRISDDQTNTNVFGNIVPLSASDMYATFVINTALEGCIWDDSDGAWEDSAGASCVPTSGGGDSEDITTGLVAHWKMNESSWNGTTDEVVDATGNGEDGTAGGGASTVAQGFDRAGDFDGVDDDVQITGLIGSPADITLAGWADLDARDTIGAELISLGDHVAIRLDDTGVSGTRGFFYDGSGFNSTTTSINHAGTGWVHVVYTFDDTTDSQKIYLDGAEAGTSSFTASISYSGLGANTFIAEHANGDVDYNNDGRIDDARVYNRALSAAEVAYLYAQTPDPVNIDDASDFGAMGGAGRQVIRTKSGTLYSVMTDASDGIEMWKSEDGTGWAEQDSAGKPTLGFSGGVSGALIDSSDVIHVLYANSNVPPDVMYTTFTTSSDTWAATPETVQDNTDAGDSFGGGAIKVDANDIPHIVYAHDEGGVGTDQCRYRNRVGASWGSAVDCGSASTTPGLVDITINEDNIPEIVLQDPAGATELRASVGNQNNATSFTLNDVDTDVNQTGDQKGVSIAVDHDGNTWIAYVDSDDDIALAKHNDADDWSIWSTITTKTESGFEPSVAIGDGRDIYVFYEGQDAGVADDIVYDVYDADAETPAWTGETVLFAGTYQDVKAKWAFEWNNFGTNKIDFLFSDGTDVFWSNLYLRRMPTNIDDASDFGALPGAGRQVVRTSSGTLYSVVNDAGNCEVWKSIDEGNSWSQKGTPPACNTSENIAVAIDGASPQIIHLIYEDDATAIIRYNTFNTSSDAFVGEGTVTGMDTPGDMAIAIDSSNIPHVAARTQITNDAVEYSNRVGGSWDSTPTSIEEVASGGFNSISITIDEDNLPEVFYLDSASNDLTAAEGDANDATAFTDFILVDLDVSDTSGIRGTSAGIDSSGNTWVAYVDASNWDGANSSIYCLSADDCKIAYYDDTGSSLKFMDCDDATCSSGIINTLDGAQGCTLTGGDNCDTYPTDTAAAGLNPSLDCSNGAADCKIAYRNVTRTALFFADCDDATCSTGSMQMLDGDTLVTCALTGGDNCDTYPTDTDNTGWYPSLDCSAGATDCKIAYYNISESALFFADCGDATCSTGSMELLDGDDTVTCALTGGDNCDTYPTDTDDTGLYPSLDCSAGDTDCKIVYRNGIESALFFADCGDATCSTGSMELLDGDDTVTCALTGGDNCDTYPTDTDSTGFYPSLDCSAGATDCKIAYRNSTEGALFFADCGDATCSTGSMELLDGDTTVTCALTGGDNCDTYPTDGDSTGWFPSLDCSAGATDCKIAYYNSIETALFFADCGDATCSTGSMELLDGDDTVTCALSGGDGCIVGFIIGNNLNGISLYCPTATDCKISYHNADERSLMMGDCEDATCSSGGTNKIDGYKGDISLVKHNDADAWGTWQTPLTDSDFGNEPSIVVDGSDIYVFYEDDQDDVAYNKYDGSIWGGEKVLEMHASLQDVKARWSFLNNPSYITYGIDYLYSDGTDAFYNRLNLGVTPGTQDAIDTVPVALADNISAVVDDVNTDVSLIFVDDEATDQVSYKRWDSGTQAWDGTATLVADAADDDDSYLTLSYDNDNNILYALWIDTTDSDIFYATCTITTECNTAGEWAAETNWKSTGTNTNVTSNYDGIGRIFAEWTVGSASPYHIQFDTIVIPENLWLFFGLGPLLPLLLRKKRKKGFSLQFLEVRRVFTRLGGIRIRGPSP